MEVNNTGITYFSNEYRLIRVLCVRGPNFPNESLRGQAYPEFANCQADANVYAAKALAQGDEVTAVEEVRKGKEATRLLYIGSDGAIVEGANQEGN